jgi:amino acid adenylation domain-containing protein
LTLNVQETPSGLVGVLEYNTDLFDRETMRRMLSHYVRLLESIAAAPQSRLSQLQMLGEQECHQQLVEWNATARAYPDDTRIHELFEAQVRLRADAIALVCEDSELTYGELNRRANQLAHRLIERGVGPEVRVGLCLPRSAQMVVGILGVLKAGGCYVPLDPSYPHQRLAHMVQDSGSELVVGESSQWTFLDPARRPSCVAVEEDQRSEGLPQGNPDVYPPSSAPAYVIYTSGSTGVPKGVRISHRNVVNFLRSMQEELSLTSRDRLLAVTTLSFDIALLELCLPLTVGGTVDIAPLASVADGERLMRRLEESRITVLQGTPVTWKLLLDSGWEGQESLTALVGGEAFSRDLASRIVGKVGRVWNLYGPTETTIWSTCCRVAEAGATWTVSIGQPIANTRVYVLDGHQQLVPVGVAGELCVGGVGVSQGYWNRPGLTAEKSVPDPYSNEPGDRLYRTGDLVRWLGDGTLEFLGRVDTQVKMRGYRIELGEIESALLSHQDVRDAVVVALEEAGDKQLVGYVVSEAGAQVGEAHLVKELRTRLQERLPLYMVPSALVVLESLPLTANGKVDRKALPAPGASVEAEYSPPEGMTEELLAQLWCVLLKRERVGRYEDFFALGGHSLLATQLVARIQQEFEIKIAVTAVFQYPILKDLASCVDGEIRVGGLDSETIERLSEEEAAEILKELGQSV